MCKRQFGALALLVIMTACVSCSRSAPPPSVMPADVPTVAATDPPALTPVPTETPTAQATIPPTPTVQATISPTATPIIEEMESDTWSSTSPDGEWRAAGMAAFFAGGGESYYARLSVTQTDGTAEWVAVDEWSGFGLGYTTPQPFHWSRDGRYLYFTNRPVVDGCGVFVNALDLQRLDLGDGSVSEMAPSLGLWLSLSPDETTLAYVGYGGRGLVLRDLLTGIERETVLDPVSSYAAGHVVWSPDGAALVLTLAIRPCFADWAESVSVLRVQVETLEQTTLIREDERLFITAEWPALERVLLRDDEGNEWWMDASTGALLSE